MSNIEQRNFLFGCVKRCAKQSKRAVENSRRENSFRYVLKDINGTENYVCKTFLLATLGFHPGNDRLLKSVRDTEPTAVMPKKDMRGHHPNSSKVDKSLLIDHIKMFRPVVSHYRREHAPNRLYLSSDISVTLMHKDFMEKHPSIKISYELYRQAVASMNISFANLGNEECFECERFNLHSKSSLHAKEDPDVDCNECSLWKQHKERYVAAREEYERDKKERQPEKLIVSADLQKVIMLPRAEMFKEVIFTPRVIVFNESFVPVGAYSKNFKPLAVIWHEGVRGRKKEDLISTFYAFFLNNRDTQSITMWLDNCAAQNKNWSLLSFFLFIVNCADVDLQVLDIKYFQSGHTFMSADAFHHQLELSLKKARKVLDFDDFKSAVQQSNSSKVNVKEMKIEDFFQWKDYSSKFKLQKVTPKPYLKNMVHLRFKRGENIVHYKNQFAGEFIPLNFLSAKEQKGGIKNLLVSLNIGVLIKNARQL
nr:unnamed protein product [Callosobruchus analis]